MIIKRTVNGQELQFALTDSEMIEAYYEQEANFDLDDVLTAVEEWSDDDCIVNWEIDLATYEQLAPKIAEEKRRLQDNYGMKWRDALEEATDKIVSGYVAERMKQNNE